MTAFFRRVTVLSAILAVVLLSACGPQPEPPLPTLMTLPSVTPGVPRLAILPPIPASAAAPLPSQTDTQSVPALTASWSPAVTDTDMPLLTAVATSAFTSTWTLIPSATLTATLTPPVAVTLFPTVTPTFTATPTSTPTFDLSAPERLAVVRSAATLYTGPGITYRAIGVLNTREQVRLVERNAIGNWVHVWQIDERGRLVRDGWVMSGYLTLSSSLGFSHLPVNVLMKDADAAVFDGQAVGLLYRAPIIPAISPAMLEIYRKGMALGNHSNAITKIGDSVTANPIYLTPMRLGNHVLGPYDYLDETIRFFGPSLATDSVAARKGLSSYGVFDPLNAPRHCNANESPLVCEYRLKRPAVAFIMFGPNDIWRMDADEFNTQMRLIVDETLRRGIIPVLTTFSSDPRTRAWEESLQFNIVLLAIADEYDVPMMNLWLASRDLPGYGLEGDGIHMKNYGYNQIKFDAGLETRFGTNLQNLVAIRTLDEIRRTVMMP